MDWDEIIRFSMSPLEIIVRGSAVYWVLFLIFRLILRRDIGALGIADVLLVVLIADASQNAMAGGYETVLDGMLLVATLVFWNLAVDWLSFRSRWVEHLLQPRPLCLIKDGKIQYRNLRREFITVEDLQSQLRQEHVEDIGSVRRAYMEGDGKISVLR